MLLILTAIIIALSLWHFIHGRVFFNTLMRIKEMNRRKEALTETEKAQHSKDTMKVLGYSIFLVSFRLFFLYNYRIALASSDLVYIAEWILRHHEWWDGSGYPIGLAGEAIPVE